MLCEDWESPAELVGGGGVLRVSLCGQIDELLVLDGGTVPNLRAAGCQARTGTTLAAAYRSARSSQWSGAGGGAGGVLVNGHSCWQHSHRRQQGYECLQPGLRLEAHRRSPVGCPTSAMQREDWGQDGRRYNWAIIIIE